jgi:two-component system sensor histidine kinase KdpD
MGARLRVLSQVRWGDYLVALGLVAAISVVIGIVLSAARIANISILYLLAVLAAAIRFGRGPAILASIAAFLTFNWFFVGPVHTLLVARPEEIVDLLVLLLAAVVTGQLAARERARHQEAEAREREAVLLQAIIAAMSEGDLDLERGLRAATDLLRRDLGLATVRVVLDDQVDPASAAGQALGGDLTAVESGHRRALPLAVHGGQSIGTLLVARPEEAPPFDAHDERILVAAAAQLGTAIERVRLRREATEAETLRRTDELKTALLSAVSHDLRTPLASIIASAGSLRQQEIAWTSEDRDEFALTIEEEAQRLNRIVGNLLDLSRIQGGSLRPAKARHDLAMLVDDVVARLRPQLPAHSFVVEVPEDLPPVLIDWVEIDQVLSNLVENAAKYSPPGTEVRIAARPIAREIEVQVADRGPGIPREALPHLFTPFFRVLGRDRMKGPQGSGLGLAVARGLIEAHGGRLGVQNRRGGGAIFTFTLPLLASAAGTTGATPRREEQHA